MDANLDICNTEQIHNTAATVPGISLESGCSIKNSTNYLCKLSDALSRFSSDVSMERMYRLSFCRNCETMHPGVGLNGKSS